MHQSAGEDLSGQEPEPDRLPGQAHRGLLGKRAGQLLPQNDSQTNAQVASSSIAEWVTTKLLKSYFVK